ncbi:glycosyltransferase family 2 protein [Thalassotalea marina]|uniref:Glycosyl transferase n=1 Tax=Thalassotalea marina TaxID=1673741 RepID=A0A919EI17_9GAMM|nr:glycosyltransferase family 2 protein [Thalassotalea marina]GHF80942.1 glycosyl transferase [Thalassotalea marina]
MYLVSIIVPYYNRSECLGPLINSVIAQSHKCWELIVVDDCSKDSEKAQAIIASFGLDKIRYIRHETNKNGAQARNTGIELAKGDFIAFLDSDDTWEPQKLALQLEKFKSTGSHDKTIVYSALNKVFADNSKSPEILPLQRKIEAVSVSDYLFRFDGLMQTTTFLLKTSFAKSLKFNPALVRHQDYDFILRAENEGAQFEFIDMPLANWITLPGEGSVVRKGGDLLFSIEWFEQYKQYMTSTGARAYLGRQMFYIAIKSKKLSTYYSYVFKTVKFSGLLHVLKDNINLVLNK